jgi:hypothetical protein
MMSVVSYERQDRILDPEVARKTHVTICGVGTVGSNVAVQLAKAGFGKFDLWDMDLVEAHNIPSQDFTVEDLGKEKTVAVRERILLVNPDATVQTSGELSGYEAFSPGVLVLAVDNMELRKTLFEQAKLNPTLDFMLDFRMGGWNLQAWSVSLRDERDCEKYAKTLYGSDEVVAATCGTRTFAPVGALSGAVGVCLLTQELDPSPAVAPPFYTNVDMSSWSLSVAGRRAVEVGEFPMVGLAEDHASYGVEVAEYPRFPEDSVQEPEDPFREAEAAQGEGPINVGQNDPGVHDGPEVTSGPTVVSGLREFNPIVVDMSQPIFTRDDAPMSDPLDYEDSDSAAGIQLVEF